MTAMMGYITTNGDFLLRMTTTRNELEMRCFHHLSDTYLFLRLPPLSSFSSESRVRLLDKGDMAIVIC